VSPVDRDIMPRNACELLDQGRYWQPKSGEWIEIAAMSDEHRLNTARMLMRKARAIKLRYEIDLVMLATRWGGPDCDDLLWEDAPFQNPTLWLGEMPLYRALVADLPEGGAAYAAVARRARHWSTCLMRLREGDPACPPDAVCTCAAPEGTDVPA